MVVVLVFNAMILKLIEKKQAGEELTSDEIYRFIASVADGSAPDYQVSALLMAIYFKGLTLGETIALTRALVKTGETLSFPEEFSPVLDKHSTGGVGDKISLILVPLLASAGFKVSKMSGRGLAHTGGTIDKLESIPGIKVQLSKEDLFNQLATVGCAIISQSQSLVPAEKKLYALRDATGTVASHPLIAASILSKKIAGGADAVVLDVKCGKGGFFKTYGDATAFTTEILAVSREFPITLTSVITDMNQPLGRMVGNALEVMEVYRALERGDTTVGIVNLAIRLGSELIRSTQRMGLEDAESLLEECFRSGKAFNVFCEMVSAQGGDLKAFLNEMEKIEDKVAKFHVKSPIDGLVVDLDAFAIGRVVQMLGGGRTKMEDRIDHFVGVELVKKIGESAAEGEPLAMIYYPKKPELLERTVIDPDMACEMVLSAYSLVS